MPAPTVAFGVYDSLFLYLEQKGIAERELCQALGINSKQEGVLFGRVPLTLLEQAFVAAEKLTTDPCIGLNMGRAALPSTYGVFYFLSIAGENLHQILVTITRFFPLMYDFITPVVTCDGVVLSIEFHYSHHCRPHRHVIEHLFSTWFTTANLLQYDEHSVPRSLYFQHEKPCCDEILSTVFPVTPVSFCQYSDRVELRSATLDYTPERNDRRLFELSEKQANQLMLRLRSRDRIAQEISCHVIALLPDGLPTIDQVAARMKCSGRSLQRRLSERHLNYQMLLDHVREKIAMDLLTSTRMPITQIASRTGFTNDSTFHRAFKRWTGHHPGYFRSATDQKRSIPVN